MATFMSGSVRRIAALSVVLPVAAFSAACAPHATVGSVAPEPGVTLPVAVEQAFLPNQRSEHVIVISVDGLRPDAIAKYRARTLQRLIAEGSHSLEATTIMPSKTLPSHTSMLTGTELHTHGVGWNDDRTAEHGHVATPTIFASAKEAGLSTAGFFGKSKFQQLAVPGTLDHARVPGGWLGKSTADGTVDAIEKYLETERPNLMFVHIGEPDFVGHTVGWMTKPYGWAVREADAEIGELLEAADRAFGEGNYTVLVTADHGGHGRDHGSEDPRDVTIPWIIWGKGVSAGITLEPGIRTMDTAATALWLLGVEPGQDSVGRVVAAAFAPTTFVADLPEMH